MTPSRPTTMASPESIEHPPSVPSAPRPVGRFVPTGLRRVVIVGGGGFGREVRWWARDAWAAEGIEFPGCLSSDDTLGAEEFPILGDPEHHVPGPAEGFLLAIGIPHVRRRVAESLRRRGAMFLSLVHPTAVVAPTARIAAGAIVCPHAVISDAAEIGSCALVNYHASVAHDGVVGSFAVLSPYATLAGGAHVGDDAFLGIHASVGPGRRLGARSKVSANSALLADAPADSLVYGVPGRVAPLLS